MTTLQQDCNRISGRMKRMHTAIEDVIAGELAPEKLRYFANRLHDSLAQGFVNQAEPAGADWDEMAGSTWTGAVDPPTDPAFAGVKHKPAPQP